jgi:predicted amidophosphoribosyltransferase
MPIDVTHDKTEPGEVQERCCMCRKPTRYWYKPKDVAVCPECAKHTSPGQLPSKSDWIKKERALTPRFVNYR